MKPQGIHFSLLTHWFFFFLNSISSNDMTSVKWGKKCFPYCSFDTQQKQCNLYELRKWDSNQSFNSEGYVCNTGKVSYDYVYVECETVSYEYNECVDIFLPAFSSSYFHSYGKVMKRKSCDEIMSFRNNPTYIGN